MRRLIQVSSSLHKSRHAALLQRTRSLQFSTALADEIPGAVELPPLPQEPVPAANVSPAVGAFAGGVLLPFTAKLNVVPAKSIPVWPVYRVLDADGTLRPGASEPELDPATAVKMYQTMLKLRAMDLIFYNAQRQGRIS
jgi:hypothetical protein